MAEAQKPHMNLAVIGHIDHGKSTLVGRLLFETGAVPAHIIEQYREEANPRVRQPSSSHGSWTLSRKNVREA